MQGNNERLSIRKGWSASQDERQAVAELREQLQQEQMNAVLFFCSSDYNLELLGPELQAAFDCPVIGCTSAGEIASGMGYEENGLVGVSFSSPELVIHHRIIHPLDQFDAGKAQDLGSGLRQDLQLSKEFNAERMFGLLLVDGLSMLEEQVVASLQNQFAGTPIVGGSAGDGLKFLETLIYADGQFISNAASFTLFETTLPFEVFRAQHFEPTDLRLVITSSDPTTRTVLEINGMPAAEEYARVLGLEVEELTSQVFATYPVMLRIGGEYFVRSIQKTNPDGSLTFFCAIDNGLVLTVAKGNALLDNMRDTLAQLNEILPSRKLILGCDCILRRLELKEKGWLDEAKAILEGENFVGFSTYGEQINGIHVNQTLTGVALGG